MIDWINSRRENAHEKWNLKRPKQIAKQSSSESTLTYSKNKRNNKYRVGSIDNKGTYLSGAAS